MTIMKNLILLLVMLLAQGAWAQQVSQSEALNRARQFFGASKQRKLKQASASTFELAYVGKQDGKTHYYVFNNPSLGDQGGFVIVGGDESARTILGYSTSGTFDYDKLPENVRWWLSEYDQQIARGIRQGVASAPRKVSHVGWTTIPDMITTKWDQGEPFNSGIPSLGPGYTGDYALATGCVATAMAQVMKYYEWPKQGVGSHELEYTISEISFSADFGATTYDWKNMPDWYYDGIYSNSKPIYNDAQAKAVGTLMYHCGVAVNMDYGQVGYGGSSADDRDVPVALINYFKYDKSAYCASRTFCTDEEWEQKIYDELKAGRPVIYGGQASNGGGHEFVCHGYDADKDFFAFNWGWGGYCDGYYPLTGTGALRPDGSGIGGAGSGNAYNLDQTALFNVMPDQGGDYIKYVVCKSELYQNFYVLSTSMDYDEENKKVQDAVESYTIDRKESSDVDLYMFCSPLNHSATSFTIDVGVKLTGVKTGDVYYQQWRYAASDISPRGFFPNLYTKFNTSLLKKNDTYIVEPVYRIEGEEEWRPILYAPEMTPPTVVVQYGPTGDVNGDGTVNISDVTLLVNIILGNATDPYGNADVNGDGTVNISDVTLLVNIILGNA